MGDTACIAAACARRLLERAAQEAWWARAWVWLSVCFQRHVMMRRRVVASPSARLRATQRVRNASAAALAAKDTARTPSALKLPVDEDENDPSVNSSSTKAQANGRAVADIKADAKARGAPARRAAANGGEQQARPAPLAAARDSAQDIEMGVVRDKLALPPASEHGSELTGADSSACSLAGLPPLPSMEAPLLRQQVRCRLSCETPSNASCPLAQFCSRSLLVDRCQGIYFGAADCCWVLLACGQILSAELSPTAHSPAAPPAPKASAFQRPSLQLKSFSEDSTEGAALSARGDMVPLKPTFSYPYRRTRHIQHQPLHLSPPHMGF